MVVGKVFLGWIINQDHDYYWNQEDNENIPGKERIEGQKTSQKYKYGKPEEGINIFFTEKSDEAFDP